MVPPWENNIFCKMNLIHAEGSTETGFRRGSENTAPARQFEENTQREAHFAGKRGISLLAGLCSRHVVREIFEKKVVFSRTSKMGTVAGFRF